MASFILRREQCIPRSIPDVFAFFADPKNLEAITPPWLNFRILTPEPIAMRAGTHIMYRLSWHRFPLRWVTEIREWEPPAAFTDVQVHGPYTLWQHSHTFRPAEGGTLMCDLVRYTLPLGPIGHCAHVLVVKADLNAIFDYRARKVAELLGYQERP
jgi:ligand-binding SRPBCC domain-containing protein